MEFYSILLLQCCLHHRGNSFSSRVQLYHQLTGLWLAEYDACNTEQDGATFSNCKIIIFFLRKLDVVGFYGTALRLAEAVQSILSRSGRLIFSLYRPRTWLIRCIVCSSTVYMSGLQLLQGCIILSRCQLLKDSLQSRSYN